MDKQVKMFRPSGEINIRNVDALQKEMLACASDGEDFKVDLSSVTGCDVAFAQLLCALKKQGAEKGRNYRLCNASPVVLTLWRELGLDEAGVFDAEK